MSNDILVGELQEIPKVKKARKTKEIPISPFKYDTNCEYYGSRPILVKWKHWVL